MGIRKRVSGPATSPRLQGARRATPSYSPRPRGARGAFPSCSPRFRGVRGAALLALFLLLAPASAMEIVREGKPVATIVVPAKPLAVVSAAARELQYHVREATGAELTLVTEDKRQEAAAGQPAIYLGACRATAQAGIDTRTLPPNGFIIRCVGNRLFLAGDDSEGEPFWVQHDNRTRVGTLFAVYELLDRHLGCRWLWPGKLGEVIPRRRNITVNAWNQKGIPWLLHSRWRDGSPFVVGTQGWSTLDARARYLQEQGVWLRRQRFALGVNMDIRHAFTGYWERFGTTHPEYFNLLPDGTRRSDPYYFAGVGELIAMCVSEPAFHRQIVEDWQATRSPQEPFVDASENDTLGKCICERCLAWDVPGPGVPASAAERVAAARKAFEARDPDWARHLGSLSDRYARFYLAVQREAEKVDPNARVMGFAYANYVKPPLKTRLNERILIGVVPPVMYPWTEAKRAAFRKQWEGWRAAGVTLMLRPNYTLDGHCFPIYFAHKLGEDFRFAAQRGLIATDFDSLRGQWATQGPNLYVLGRLHARPNLTTAQVLSEYFRAFGKAEPAVRAYFAHWEKVSDSLTDERIAAIDRQRSPEGGGYAYFHRTAPGIFTPAVMARGRALLARAKRAAAGDPIAAARVAFLEKGLRNAELTLAAQAAFEHYKKTGAIAGYRKAIQALDAYRKRVEGDNVANMAALAWMESLTWERSLLSLLSDPGTPLEGPWRFAWDPNQRGEGAGWAADDFDDAGWQTIGIDGPWEKQPVGQQWRKEHGSDYDGIAWYRTRFSVKPAARPQQVRLVFGAVDEACTLWVNGQKLLERPFPYQGNNNSWQEAFEVDVTAAVRTDRPNTLAVRVEDNSGAGGIWRPVWVVQSDAPAAAEANLILNGGFEADEPAWGQSIMCGKFTLTLDDQVARSGRRSARIECTEIAPPEAQQEMRTRAWGRWYRTGIRVQPRKTYRLRVWVKTSADFRGTLAVWLLAGGSKGTLELKTLNTEGIWRLLSLGQIAPEAEEVSLYLNLMHGTGTAWFDDVELVEE